MFRTFRNTRGRKGWETRREIDAGLRDRFYTTLVSIARQWLTALFRRIWTVRWITARSVRDSRFTDSRARVRTCVRSCLSIRINGLRIISPPPLSLSLFFSLESIHLLEHILDRVQKHARLHYRNHFNVARRPGCIMHGYFVLISLLGAIRTALTARIALSIIRNPA